MRYLIYTYVDRRTGVPITDAPAPHGPVMPAVPGLTFGFALESRYPTDAPVFYGVAPDDASLDVPGAVREVTAEEYQAAHEAELAARAELAAAREAEARARMTVSRFQARAALLQAGLLDRVEALMADAETPALARLAWREAVEFRRTSPTVQAMAGALGWDEAQIDALFRAAGEIEA